VTDEKKTSRSPDARSEGALDPRIGLAAVKAAPDSLRERVLAAIGAAPQISTSPRAGVTLVRTEASEWKNGPAPGVRYKEIHRDPQRGARSILYRMEPGSKFPDHRHDFLEEIFVLEGSAWLSGQLLRAGDYCCSNPGTEDYAISTAEGTTFLVFLTEEAARP
jgi:quercetin dioxygenase-like cupin family protein